MASIYIVYYALLYQFVLHCLCLDVKSLSCFDSSNSLNCDYSDLSNTSRSYNCFLSDNKGRLQMSKAGLNNLELPLELFFFGIEDGDKSVDSNIAKEIKVQGENGFSENDENDENDENGESWFGENNDVGLGEGENSEKVADGNGNASGVSQTDEKDKVRTNNILKDPLKKSLKKRSAAAFGKLTLMLTNIFDVMHRGISEINISTNFLQDFDMTMKNLHYNVRMITIVLRVGIPFMDRLVSSSYIQNTICLRIAGQKTSMLMILQEQLSIFKKANALFGYLGMSNTMYHELKIENERFAELLEAVKLEMKVIDLFSDCIRDQWENLDRKIELLRLKYEYIMHRKNLLDSNMQIYREFKTFSTRIVQIGRYVYHKLKPYKALKFYFNLWPRYLKEKPLMKYVVNLSGV